MIKKFGFNLIKAGLTTLAVGTLLWAPISSSRANAETKNGSAVIYDVYPTIFSPAGDLNGVTSQLDRLKKLGVTVVWIMPINPIGQPFEGHPAFDSPYCVQDFYAINPAYGSEQDLTRLVVSAHRLGMRVILDEVVNHSSWDNALITKHPEFYVHSDNDPMNSNSIVRAYTYNDVAQFNFANPALRAYMIQMLSWWLTKYHVDGFRFDSADNPPGPNRTVPASFWQSVGRRLKAIKPDILMIGETESSDLENKPFQIVYGWDVYYRLKETITGASAANAVRDWHKEMGLADPIALYMSLQDDWDFNRDVSTFGGPAGARAVAVFNCTNVGVPLIYNGMEIGNGVGGINPHNKIDWSNVSPGYSGFYAKLLALRGSSPALQQGGMQWLTNTAPAHLLTYKRTGGGQEFIVEINVSNQPIQARLAEPAGPNWKEIGTASGWTILQNADPSTISLPPMGFALYERSQK